MKALYCAEPMREALADSLHPGGLTLTCRLLELVDTEGRRVIDVGCGCGSSLALVAGDGNIASALGIDRSPALLREAKKRNIITICGSMDALPVADGCCDFLLCECAWSLSNRQQSLAEFHRILAPGGVLAISDIFSRSGREGQWPVSCCCAQALPLAEIEAMVTAAGFIVEHCEDHTPLLKKTAAELIFRHGSLESFWEKITGDPAGAKQACAAGRTALPGLFLLITRKPGDGGKQHECVRQRHPPPPRRRLLLRPDFPPDRP